jgi:uncharacterized protein (DUF1810 family)
MTPDPHHLERFVTAQKADYDQALSELRAGRKRSHWMWYVFPQFAGLGKSEIAHFYAIKSIEEAKAYLMHPLLGPRLTECCEALLAIEGRTANEILGFPDDLKLCSSAPLFDKVAGPESPFQRIIARYFDGRPDPHTFELLRSRNHD